MRKLNTKFLEIIIIFQVAECCKCNHMATLMFLSQFYYQFFSKGIYHLQSSSESQPMQEFSYSVVVHRTALRVGISYGLKPFTPMDDASTTKVEV